MFETQQYEVMDAAAPDMPRKRGRDDEQDFANAGNHISFSEHRNVSPLPAVSLCLQWLFVLQTY